MSLEGMELHFDLDKIKQQVKQVIQYSQECDYEPKIDSFIEDWYKGKERFLQHLNGNLIYEAPGTVTFEMSHQDKIKNIDDLITDLDYDYSLHYNDNLLSFIEENKEYFYLNQVGKNFTFIDSFGETITIPKGMKLNKALKFFIEDKENLTEIQNRISRMIQNNKVSGKLCLSIHPLDFLSTSENVHNWRSCHALDGEFRLGGFSYAVDHSTVVCYLKSEKEENILPNFPSSVPWNSKKWRVLIHFSSDLYMAFAGRPYPFMSVEGLKMVKDLLLSTFGEWTDWDNKRIDTFKHNNGELSELYKSYYSVGGELKSLHSLIKNQRDFLGFNDLISSNYYKPYYSYRGAGVSTKGYHWTTKNTEFLIGGKLKCFCCGEQELTDPGTTRCIECEEKYGTEDLPDYENCSDCGARKHVGNLILVTNSNGWHYRTICADCAKNYSRCVRCGAVIDETAEFFTTRGETVCRNCRDVEE